ncbi:hypothetical protein FJZ19_05010 [Candidatus Pacearchaeota archaeon]|nr:hypothetical protein [Candidatus Pacearchaeota archaeon]
MKKVSDELKEKENKIVTTAYEIALIKQDIALGVVDAISEIIKQESNTKMSKEEIADKVFDAIKDIPNGEIEEYIKAKIKEKPKLKLKIEKKIISKIKDNT